MDNREKIWTIIGIVVVVILIVALGTVLFAQYAAVDGANGLPYNGVGDSQSSTAIGQPGGMTGATTTTSTTTHPTSPFKAYVAPASGAVGTAVTIHGSGFGATNIVTMNGLTSASLKNIASSDGHILKFVVPEELGPNCKPDQMCAQFLLLVSPNTYKISVITGSTTQDIGTFTVTGKALMP